MCFASRSRARASTSSISTRRSTRTPITTSCSSRRPATARTVAARQLREKADEQVPQLFQVLDLTLPDKQHVPSRCTQRLLSVEISLHVPRQFLVPIGRVRSGRVSDPAAWIGMLVPKTAMNENHLVPTPEHQIRVSRKVFLVKPVSISKAVNESPNSQFWLHALALDTPHVVGPAFRGDPIHCSYDPSEVPVSIPATKGANFTFFTNSDRLTARTNDRSIRLRNSAWLGGSA